MRAGMRVGLCSEPRQRNLSFPLASAPCIITKLKSVLFFAGARERAGVKEVKDFVLPENSTVKEFLDAVIEAYPTLKDILDTLAVAVNEEYVEPEHLLADGDEVAIIPPISGG